MAETAKDELKKMAAWNVDPQLTDGEIDELLAQSSRVDSAGLAPAAPGWEPTYDLNAAAEFAWLVKAGRASELVEIDPPGSGIFTAKVFDNCRAMARVYAGKRTTVSRT
ncbi:MAG: hypothetical protein WBD22_09085 [Pyrinomonadaceae bacterium]